MFGSYSKLPGGDIHPSRFVTLGTDGKVTESAAGDSAWGISPPSTRYQALDAIDDGLVAKDGDPPINVYGPGDDQAPLELGGTVAIGGLIKATTNGKGLAATADKDRACAIAVTGGVSGDIIKVKPLRFDLSI